MEPETFMKGVSLMTSLLSGGATLKNLIEGNATGPGLQDIVQAVGQEVREIFRAETLSNEVQQAAIALATTKAWLAEDYLVQKAAAVSADNKEEHRQSLYEELTSGSDHEGIGQLEQRRENMLAWADGDAKSTIYQATSLYLGIAAFICLLYRERSEQRRDPAEAAGDLTSMRAKAKDQFEASTPRFEKIVRERLASVRYIDGFFQDPRESGGALVDSWLPDGVHGTDAQHFIGNAVLFTPGASTEVKGVVRAYYAYLATGTDDALATLNAAIDQVPKRFGVDVGQAFRSQIVPQATSFVQWAAHAREALRSLHDISGAAAPATQDGWHWCSRCNVLNFGASKSWCHSDGLRIPG